MMSSKIVSTEQGTLRGDVRKDIHGNPFYSFLSIPYAKPPVGNLRFKPPQPPEPWTGIRDATKPITPCLAQQWKFTPTGAEKINCGSEDCLMLNVYTHKLLSHEKDPLKPVMVFIHGGAFTLGSSHYDELGPQILMTGDIVLVTINYRLGIFGFLDINELGIGNAGLKDMVMSLKWVQKNIDRFGGDPSNVTIFGISAGGAAVHFLILSQLAKGLFHKAIMQSGSALNNWTRGQEDNGYKVAQHLGFNDKEPTKILEFLQNQPPEEILKVQTELGDHFFYSQKRVFCPTIEKKSKSAAIYEEPLTSILSGNFNDVPTIMGYTSAEGLFTFMAEAVGLKMSKTEFVPFFMGLEPNSSEYDEVNNKIINYYFEKQQADPSNLLALTKIATDITFARGVYQSARKQVIHSRKQIYFYRMSLDTSMNMKHKLGIPNDFSGACHGDDTVYLFVTPLQGVPQYSPDSPEGKGIRCFVKLWTNFAKTGNPTCELDDVVDINWKPVTSTEFNYLDLGQKLTMCTDPDKERMEFWDELYNSVNLSF